MAENRQNILVKGAGVGGLTVAYELAIRGASVTVSAPLDAPIGAASWFAGGMLAPHCEHESAEERVETLGLQAMKWWAEKLPHLVQHNGTLVVASSRDRSELNRFASRTRGHQNVDTSFIAKIEPDLADRFNSGLFFADETHIDPRQALLALKAILNERGVHFVDKGENETPYDTIIDATGRSQIGKDPSLRGVRGEMLLLRTSEINLSRPIRLLHPRIPLYIVPRSDHIFMVGATMIESDSDAPISARSMMEFLNAAYALHPAFGEAEIIEAGIGVRPSYPDNFPRVSKSGNHISINGFYRHGYLLAPAMAMEAAQLALD